MTEETSTLTGQAPPPVRDWPPLDLDGTDFDPVLAGLMREGPLTRIRLPFGEGWAWLATRYEDVKLVTNNPRFGRNEVTRRQASTVPTTVVMPIAMVASPTAPCRPRLAQVSQRAETASGTAITVDSAPMPIIEPTPNSAT